MKHLNQWVLAAAAMLAVAGCGQPELIDRTQPNYMKKSDLLNGQWYIKETIVDGPKTPSSVTAGFGGIEDKIFWEIQENQLVGYRAYEINPGADPRVDREKSRIGKVLFQNGKQYKGNAIVAYAIQSHFDRQRVYNPATGEQSNVLVEDSSDRPWYEREYMRVAWSRNLTANATGCTSTLLWDYQCVGQLGPLRQVTQEDTNARDEAMVLERDASGKLKYFDTTVQMIVDPPSIYYEGYGNLPFCFFNQQVDCESVDVKIRTSFLRVDDDLVRDYEPLTYSEKAMVKFGYFRSEAYSYTKDYYYTESGRQLFAQRHNIWGKSKDVVKDAQGNPVLTALGEPKLKSIPVEQRTLKPIVYYVDAQTPSWIMPITSMREAKKAGRDPFQTVEASWDHAYRRAVAVPRGLEAPVRYDYEKPAGANEVPQMFFVCRNPVQDGDPAACGKPGTYARMGDIRYSMIPYVQQNSGGLLGLGPSFVDPETGMVVSAAANIYGPGLDTWAGSSLQVMEYLNGDVTIEDLVLGRDAKNYVFANLNATDPRRTAASSSSSQLTSAPQQPMSSFARPRGRLETLINTWVSNGRPPIARENRKEVVKRMLAQNPELEAELVNLDEVRKAVMTMTSHQGFLARLNSDSTFYKQVALNVLFGDDPIEKARQKAKQRSDSKIGCMYEFEYSDEDYIGVAKRKKALYDSVFAKLKAEGSPTCANRSSCSDAEAKRLAKSEVYDELRREAYRSVTEHEVGHTLGLRHNFIASADPINYQDGYWDLRKETIGVTVGGQRVLPVTPQNMMDAARLSQKQIDEGLYEYTYSSIMDYGARVTAQNKGIGKYDEAAILFAYAGGPELGWVEVFNNTRNDYQNPNITVPVDNTAKVFTVRGAHTELPLATLEHYTPVSNYYTDKFHYTTLPFHFADPNPNFAAALDQGIARMKDRSFRKWSEMQKYYDALAVALKDYNLSARYFEEDEYTKSKVVLKLAEPLFTEKGLNRRMPVEVPYNFCSDSEVGANLMCNRQDQGADVYEMTTKWLERFNQSYIFANFRRDRLNYSPIGVVNSKFGRYLANVPNVYHHWLFNIYSLNRAYQLFRGTRISQEDLDRYDGLGDPIWQNYFTMAVVDSVNLLMEQLSVPNVGYHGRRADGVWEYVPTGDAQNRRRPASEEATLISNLRSPQDGGVAYSDVVYVPRGPGRSTFSIYDTFGYDSFSRINETGHFWDGIAAVFALMTSDTNFIGVDRGSDALRYSIPYYMTFNRELAPLFNAFWTRNDTYYASKLAKLPDGTAMIEKPTFVQAQNYISDFNYPPTAPTPVDSSGSPLAMEKVLASPSWSLRFQAQVWSMAFFTENYNMEFANFNKVFRLGSGDAITPEPGFDVVQFADPYGGGYVYAALQITGDTNPPAGPYTVGRANSIRAKMGNACPSPGQVVNFRGGLECCTDSSCANRVATSTVDSKTFKGWEGELRETIRLLEMMRGLYNIFGR